MTIALHIPVIYTKDVIEKFQSYDVSCKFDEDVLKESLSSSMMCISYLLLEQVWKYPVTWTISLKALWIGGKGLFVNWEEIDILSW